MERTISVLDILGGVGETSVSLTHTAPVSTASDLLLVGDLIKTENRGYSCAVLTSQEITSGLPSSVVPIPREYGFKL